MTIHGYLVMIEIKQSRADFKQDKKWPTYLDYCNKLYFGFPADLWAKLKGKDLIPKGVGVLVLSEKTGRVFVAQKAKHRDLDEDTKNKLVYRMAWRGTAYNRKNTPRTYPIFLNLEDKK